MFSALSAEMSHEWSVTRVIRIGSAVSEFAPRDSTGKLYKYKEDTSSGQLRVEVYISFGGLLMLLKVQQRSTPLGGMPLVPTCPTNTATVPYDAAV